MYRLKLKIKHFVQIYHVLDICVSVLYILPHLKNTKSHELVISISPSSQMSKSKLKYFKQLSKDHTPF